MRVFEHTSADVIVAISFDSDLTNLAWCGAEFQWRVVIECRRNIDHGFVRCIFITIAVARSNNQHNIFECLQPIVISFEFKLH